MKEIIESLLWLLGGTVVLFVVIILMVGFVIYASASAFQANAEADKEIRDYWNEKKKYAWDELNEEEQNKLVWNRMAFDADCGLVRSAEEIREDLKKRLPIIDYMPPLKTDIHEED